ncbi:MAG: beta-ketoacyl synthase N-terminal-like domain-containing protein, partial [Myxococcota bacterium]
MTDDQSSGLPSDAIAIIGMAGRFPGASTVAELWRLLVEGRRGIRTLSEAELRASGVSDEQLGHPDYVRARGVLADVDTFDAAFFGMSPREAAFTDPQHRLFLECAFDALEDAAIDPARGDARIGVFGGVTSSSYFLNQVLAGTDPLTAGPDGLDRFRQGSIGSEKDFLTTRVSYRLNLRGPSVDVQTACSTSAVAVHFAAQSLLMHGCDVALAGGASVFVPHQTGYLAQAGGVLSKDGFCRPFEASASGAVPGSGAAIVVLRRLDDAIASGDPIRAILIGSAVNNDGAMKVGYGAPSVDGQAEVIQDALAVADVPASSIGFVETHGTGTRLGDPIEIAALKTAFGASTQTPTALGAIKANIGHLDAAAGIVGLVKAVLALEHATIPPQPSFTVPSPEIDLEERFRVPTTAMPWISDSIPRRAGVSSFGIGGTNAHLVLQAAPQRAFEPAQNLKAPALIAVSARTPAALLERGVALSKVLEPDVKLKPTAKAESTPTLADVARTLDEGRQAMTIRQAVVASNVEDAASRLGALTAASSIQRVVFLLPGQGSQRLGMAQGLLNVDVDFHRHLKSMCDRLAPALGLDPWPLYAAPASAAARAPIDETWLAQPLLFALEVALGRRWL